MLRISAVYGKIEDHYFLTTYKIGANTVSSLSKKGTLNSKNISLSTTFDFNPTVLIRQPKKRFYSGLVQTALHIYTNTKHKLYKFKVPNDIYKSTFFTRLLNEHWDEILYDPNLAPYHEFAYRFSNKNNFNTMDIEDWKPNGQTNEMKHSNSARYLEIDKAFAGGNINTKVLNKINNYLDLENYYYNLCKNEKQSILI